MKERMSASDFRRKYADAPELAAKKAWSNAKRTVCEQGHPHPSKMESRVCDRLAVEAQLAGLTLYQQVRLPVWNLAPRENGRAMYVSIDFAMVRDGKLLRLIDAKSERKSRDWDRGARAVESCYGIKVEEVDR